MQSAFAWPSDYDSWQYRKAITINGSDSGLTDYQVPINLTNLFYNNDGLMGSWHFSNNDTTDSSGLGNHGIQNGGVNCSAIGKVGGGCEFDGMDDNITFTAMPVIENWTAIAWIKHKGSWNVTENIVSGSGGSETHPLISYFGRIGMDDLSIYNSNVLDNNWHFVVTKSGFEGSHVYVDGVEVANSTTAVTISPNTIGSGHNEYFNGTIDEIRIYNRSLPAQEISELYSAGKARLDLQDIRFIETYTVYELPINISGATLTGYQVLINITNQTIISHMRSDGGDLRFFNYSTATPYANQSLPFWVESVTANQAIIWLKTNASAGGTIIYMYHGNVSATYNNSLGGNSTFEFFDDFNRANGALGNGWSVYDGSSAVESNYGKIVSGGSTYGMSYKPFSQSNNIVISYSFADFSGLVGTSLLGILATSNDIMDANALSIFHFIASNSLHVYDDTADKGGASYTYTNDAWYNVEWIIKNDYSMEARIWPINGTKPSSPSFTVSAFTPTVSGTNFRLSTNSANGLYAYFDNIRVRKYNSTEPTATLGSETVKSTNNDALMSHWQESDNLAWVKVPSVAANISTTVYMYYGNPSAAYNNSLGGINTFEFFPIGISEFEDTYGGSGTWVQLADNEFSRTDGSGWAVRMHDYGAPPYVIEADIMETSPASGYPGLIIFRDTTPFSLGTTSFGSQNFDSNDIRFLSNGDKSFAVGHSNDVYYPYKVVDSGSLVDVYFNNGNKHSASSTANNGNTQIGIGGNSGNAKWKNFRVRKYTSFEPNAIFGSEEAHPIYWLKTYSPSGSAKSFFAINESVAIKAKAQNISSTITVTDPDGFIIVNNANMANETALSGGVLVWNYSFNLTGKAGWYDVRIFGNEQQGAFFAGGIWQNNWTDSSGKNFPFRIRINVSEPNVIERFFEPVDINLNFAYKANASSIRVAQWNGTHIIDVPSQSYNLTYSGAYAASGNIVFLTTSGKNQNATYYIYYARSNSIPAYGTDLGAVNNSGIYEIENSNYKISLDETQGGVIQNAFNKKGTNENLAGSNPMQQSPEASGASQYRASSLATPEVSLLNGSLFAKYITAGTYGNMKFNMSYRYYSHAPYIILDTTVNPTASETWDDYYDQHFRVKDGYFSKATWKNSTGVFEYGIGSGNGNDQANMGDLDWIAAYNNISSNSFGTIFLERSQSKAYSQNSDFNDDSSYERYRRDQFVDQGSEVTSADYFYSKTAIVIWNAIDGYEKLNETYYQLKNPLGASIGASESYDTEAPINTSSGFIPTSPQDNESTTCFSYWTDNFEIDYAIITVNSSGYNNQSIVQINANESWANYTIDAAVLEAGTVTCNITVYDTSQLANSTHISFSVSDNTAPYFTSITNQPNTNLSLDPGVRINITANLTEYTNISSTILQYRNDSGAAWQNITMNNTWNGAYIHTYVANFTPDINGTWQYRIYANDTLGNSNYSEIINLFVFYEYTWQMAPAAFGAVSGALGTNISVGNLIINNTADVAMEFKITSDWENKDQIFFNNTPEGSTGITFGIAPMLSVSLPVKVTAKSLARSDGLTITIDAVNNTAQPDANTTTATVVSRGAGPFLLVSITQYNATVTQGDAGIILKATVRNMGNETATNTRLAYLLPSGWTVSSGTQNKSVGNLAPYGAGIASNDIIVAVSASASTGQQTVWAISRSSENNTGTDDFKTVSVAEKYVAPPPETTITYVGGSTGGASLGLTPEQKEKLLQTEETYELVRGREENFTLNVGNPFGGVLENVSVRISGYLAQYLRIEPNAAVNVPVNGSFKFTIVIEAPKYFTKGEYPLDFFITGIVKKTTYSGNSTSSGITNFKEARKVTFIIHEVSRNDALMYISESTTMISEIKGIGLNAKEISDMFLQMNNSMGRKDYENVKLLYESIKGKKEKALSTVSILDDVRGKIKDAERSGIEVSGTQRLLMLAEAAIERQDYDTALKRAEDARVTYAMETVGKFNLIAYAKNEWKTLSVVLLVSAALLWFVSRGIRLALINRRLRRLKEEETILLGLVKEVQTECFTEGKLSMEEYMDGLVQYERRLGKVVQETIELETKKAGILKLFSREVQRLIEEKKKLLGLMEETQRLYVDGGKFETRIYKSRMDAYIEKLAEIEEKLATLEANAAIKRRWI